MHGFKRQIWNCHEWEFFLSDTQLLSAVYDISETNIVVNCRNDVFKGISDAFRNRQNIFFQVQKVPHTCLVFKSYIDTDSILSSKMTITTSEKCEIQFLGDEDTFQISFALPDFLIGLKIANILSQKLSISMIEPGYPLILKAEMSNLVAFEMPLATATNDATKEVSTEQEVQQETPIQSHSAESLNEPKYSQISPWPIAAVNNQNQDESKRHSQMDNLSERFENAYSQDSFEDSSQFPFKRRRTTGQFAEASQPQSDTSDSDFSD